MFFFGCLSLTLSEDDDFILLLLQYSLPDGLGDALIVEVHDSKRKYCGRVVAQVAEIADDPVGYRFQYLFLRFKYRFIGQKIHCINWMQGDKLRWWSIYQEPEHELVGRMQLYINYSTSSDEMSHLKVCNAFLLNFTV